MNILELAAADTARDPPLLYGQRIINGLPQRGPDSYDCIGWVRRLLLLCAPQFWPTSWGGPDSWTVPNFYGAWVARGLPRTIGPAKPGDIVIWLDGNNRPQHIGIAANRDESYSALNTSLNILRHSNLAVGWPRLVVLPTGLSDAVLPIVTAEPIEPIRWRTRYLGQRLSAYDPTRPGGPVRTIRFWTISSAYADARVRVDWPDGAPRIPRGYPFLRVSTGAFAGLLVVESQVRT